MDFTTVPSVETEILGKTRRLRLVLASPGWYKTITHKRLDDLIRLLQHQLSAGMAAKRVNDAHAEALGVPVEQLPADEVVDPDSLLDAKDKIDVADMVPDVIAAVYCLAHWEDITNRPQGKKDVPLPGELTYEDMNTQLDLDAFPQLMVLLVQVYALHAMKVGKDTENDPKNVTTPSPPLSSSGELPAPPSDLPPTNS
jgi:hypothetical protein